LFRILLGTDLKTPSFELRRFRASDAAEITAGKEPAKGCSFASAFFARERKQQSLKEETWQ
jgi:hypothetical protein